MAVNVAGLVSVIVFYIIILTIGVLAARKSKKSSKSVKSEKHLLASRGIGVFVGTFTLTATWVGGGYTNGTAEIVFKDGLIWCQAPFGYAISLVIGGLFFAKKMRAAGYVTMIDPLQQKFGRVMGALLCFPPLLGEIFWSAAILKALGATLTIILDLDQRISVVLSTCIAVIYTLLGGLLSVAYTDVVQLFCIFFGLWLSVPFAIMHPAVNSLTYSKKEWYGSLNLHWAGVWVDGALLLICGGVPWQVYFQRVLAAKTPDMAKALSIVAGVGCAIMSVPPIIIGIIGAETDWTETNYRGAIPIPDEDKGLILPIVLQYLTPVSVAFFGLGGVSAAVMSSSDSSCLSGASMFSNNIFDVFYRIIKKKEPSEKLKLWIIRGGIVVVGILAMSLSLTISSIYGLFFLCSDLIYVILFPQLVSGVFLKFTNTYGSVAGYVVGFILRVGGGEPLLGLPPFIRYPFFDETDGQLFPFRTFSMLINLFLLCTVSLLTSKFFERNTELSRWDIFNIQTHKGNQHEGNDLQHLPVKENMEGGKQKSPIVLLSVQKPLYSGMTNTSFQNTG